MTCAGLASMLVTHEYLQPAAVGDAVRQAVGRDPYSRPVRKALNWFEQGNDAMVMERI